MSAGGGAEGDKVPMGRELGEEAHRSSLVGFICCGKGFLSFY